MVRVWLSRNAGFVSGVLHKQETHRNTDLNKKAQAFQGSIKLVHVERLAEI